MSKVVRCVIESQDIAPMKSKGHIISFIRERLKESGFKFKDDGLPSSILNENPEPMGTMSWYECQSTNSMHYKQILEED